MNDDNFEEHLKRYRPAGPPVEMRGRVLNRRQTVERSRVREWLPAAAAAAAIVVFSLMSANARKGLAASMSVVTEQRDRRVAELATALGSGVLAEVEAERLVQADSERAGDGQ
jgi:hypothetical protein